MFLVCKPCGSNKVTEIYAMGVSTPTTLCLDCGSDKAVRRPESEAPRPNRPTVGLTVYRQRKVERSLPPSHMERTLNDVSDISARDDLVALLLELKGDGC